MRIAFSISFCLLLTFPNNELTNSMVSFKLVCSADGEVVTYSGEGEVDVCGDEGEIVACGADG